ncbi:serine hydrolase [Rhizobium sp. 2YAF20]|uniref:serine hydrolase n=1 Tax=Rhizobium sp. 2YAF20 TaxID=3233027 RepID=UPI003F94ADD5
MKKILVAFSAALVLLNSTVATFAGSAYLVMDGKTGKILTSDSADELNHPASLTKMMTLYLAFEALHRGKLGWDTKMKVSSNAANKHPTKLGLKAGTTVTVREAVNGMIIKSANDAATVMAETLGGSESGFGRIMTQKARALGMSRTVFVNPSGLPDPRQITTARDMSTLAVALINDFPGEYRLFSQTGFVYRGRPIRGHNNLMYRYQGMDGIKTGYTDASGFNIVSAVRDGNRRVIGVVMGGATARSRDDKMAGLLHRYVKEASSTGNTRLVASIGSRNRKAVEVASVAPDVDIPSQQAPRHVDAVITQSIAQATAKSVSPTKRGPAPLAPPSNIATETGVDMAVPLDRPQVQDEIINAGKPDAGRWQVQIAATPSAKAAKDILTDAQSKTGNALHKASPYTEAFGEGGSKVYRARFVGFDSRDAAASACKALKKHAFDCLLLPSQG